MENCDKGIPHRNYWKTSWLNVMVTCELTSYASIPLLPFYASLAVDDSTGVINCICWKKSRNTESSPGNFVCHVPFLFSCRWILFSAAHQGRNRALNFHFHPLATCSEGLETLYSESWLPWKLEPGWVMCSYFSFSHCSGVHFFLRLRNGKICLQVPAPASHYTSCYVSQEVLAWLASRS